MKLQIISKLTREQSQNSTLANSRELDRNNRDHHKSIFNVHSQYFPTEPSYKEQPKIQQTQRINHQHFFDNFHSNCFVRYQKVQHEPIQVRRKLELTLASLATTPAISPFKGDYDFSFKKLESTVSTFKLQAINSQESQKKQEDRTKNYYFNQKTKIKLRKFHSLLALKTQQSERKQEAPRHQVLAVKKNLSLAKKIQSPLVKMDLRPSCKRLQSNCQDSRREANSLLTQQNCMNNKNGEAQFEQQKQRLARIRRQLNQIYQMRKFPSQLKLKLF